LYYYEEDGHGSHQISAAADVPDTMLLEGALLI
jgi:hypothetical protein